MHFLCAPPRDLCYAKGVSSFSPGLPSAADTVPKVIHRRREKAPRKPSPSPAPAVNNFAARKKLPVNKIVRGHIGVGSASKQTRSSAADSTRVKGRTPAASQAPVEKSERTPSHEDPVSARLPTAAVRRVRQTSTPKSPMIEWSQIQYFAGFDWASQGHQVVIVNKEGVVVADFKFDHNAQGWALWRQKAAQFAPLAVCIETSQGSIVERLLQTDNCVVYPINPKAAKAYVTRKAPSGVKTDYHDAWSFADALRVDGHGWRRLLASDPLLEELRLLCRDEIALIEERTALVNQLRMALREYYPVALEAFEDWTAPSAWAFVQRFPTPTLLASAGPRQWQKFLHTHKLYRPETAERRMKLFASAQEFGSGQALTEAKSRLAQTRARQLALLQRELDEYRQKIEQLFAHHPDHDLFGSLPGAGPKIAPRLLSELGDDRSVFKDSQALQCYAGAAPVSFQSGQIRKAQVRWHCNKLLRATVHLWADLSRRQCPWAQIYYKAARDRGKTHAAALRCLGQRWLKILWKMWQTHTRYDAELHAKNQLAHGSWLLQLKAS